MENNLKIWIILAFTVASTCLARTPLDTLALERSDSGSRYIKVHGLTQRYLDQASQNYGIPWNSNINYGFITDARDGQVYRTVVIGTQTWMAQNLNYYGSNGLLGTCYNGVDDNCNKYGRLYSWNEAMSGYAPSNTDPSGVRGICPTGYHIPSAAEWIYVRGILGGAASAGKRLKSARGWNSSLTAFGSGDDSVGFRGVPAGYFYISNGLHYTAGTALWSWSASVNDTGGIISYKLSNQRDSLMQTVQTGTYFSLRCVKD